MSQTAAPSWHETNQQALLGAIAQIRQRLEAKLNHTTPPGSAVTLPSSSALAQLSRLFYLTPFEQDLLTLCAVTFQTCVLTCKVICNGVTRRLAWPSRR